MVSNPVFKRKLNQFADQANKAECNVEKIDGFQKYCDLENEAYIEMEIRSHYLV